MCCREGVTTATLKKRKVQSSVEPAQQVQFPEERQTKAETSYSLLSKLHTKSISDSKLYSRETGDSSVESQFSKFKSQQSDVTKNASSDSEDLDVLSLLKHMKSSAKKIEPARVATEGSIADDSSRSSERPMEYTITVYDDIEQVNKEYQLAKEREVIKYSRQHPMETTDVMRDTPQSLERRESTCGVPNSESPYCHKYKESGKERYLEKSTIRQREPVNRKMEEILDNSLEEELEGMFGSDVEFL